MTSSMRARSFLPIDSIPCSLASMRSAMLMATRTPLMGRRERYRFSIARKASHSSRSSDSVDQRPAVSRRMASLVNHQSTLRVPPTPRTAPPPAPWKGKTRPECLMAVVLPAPGGPMIMYQGSE